MPEKAKQKQKQEQKKASDCTPKKSWKTFFDSAGKKDNIPVSRDWTIVLGASFVLMISIFAYNGFLFWQMLGGGVPTDNSEVQRKRITVDRIDLEDVLERFEKKEQSFESLKNDPPNVVDPSS